VKLSLPISRLVCDFKDYVTSNRRGRPSVGSSSGSSSGSSEGGADSIHQYLLHAKVCQNWGYQGLAEQNHKESLEEWKHAEALMERILFLKDTPNMTDLFEIKDCSGALA
jgi:hypothetical protein